MTIDPPQPLQGGLFSLNHGMFHPRNGPLRIEPKYDGFRCLITRHGAYARSGRKLPQARIFEPLMDYLPEEAKWFDCELLGTRTRGQNIALVVFDVAMPGELHERLDYIDNLQEDFVRDFVFPIFRGFVVKKLLPSRLTAHLQYGCLEPVSPY